MHSDRRVVHLGSLANGRPDGIRPGSEVGTVIHGGECAAGGMGRYKAAKRVVMTKGFDGVIPGGFIIQFFLTRNGRILRTRPSG